MKKSGFTLAEVLITLGIIGVVAALTAPALVTSSRNEANAAKLAVVVSNLENAFTTAIAQEGVQDIFHTQMWTHSGAINSNSTTANKRIFAGELGKYLIINGVRANSANEISNYYGASGGNLNVFEMGDNGEIGNRVSLEENDLPNFVPIEMKNGAVVFIRTFLDHIPIRRPEASAIADGSALTANAADIFVDVNGASAPNTFGRDIFVFYVGQNGILYPFGGADIAGLEGDAEDDWRNSSSWQACLPEEGHVGDAGTKGLGCTARLISENYKMNY